MTALPREHDRLLEQWRERLQKVRHEIITSYLDQDLWTQVRAQLQESRPGADATWFMSYSRLYVGGQLSLVRRLADTDPKSHSLASLIMAIVRNPGVMTRTRYGDAYATRPDIGGRALGEAEWDRRFADPDKPEQVSQAILANDLSRLQTSLEHLTTWATKTVAHLDPKRPERVPLYSEIPEALTLLGAVTNNYQLLLNQSTTLDWTPVIQGDWRSPFRAPLFTAFEET